MGHLGISCELLVLSCQLRNHYVARARWMLPAMVPVLAVCAASAAWAQNAASGAATKPAMMAKDADPDWEVVSVKAADPDDKYDFFNIKGRHVVIRNEPVLDILRTAYGMQKSQFVGMPDWIKTERYNVDGVPDAAGVPSANQMHALMRKLLAERFGLKAHHEQREMEVYALTVAKGGPQMEPSNSAADAMPGNAGGQDNGRQTRKYLERLHGGPCADASVQRGPSGGGPDRHQGTLRLHDEVDGGPGTGDRAGCASRIVYCHSGTDWAEAGADEGTGGCAGGGCGGAADGELATQRVSERE